MAIADKIQQRVLDLPEPMQAEVLDFVEFLLFRLKTDQNQAEFQQLNDKEWSRFSLTSAMRGMENEDEPSYMLSDLKERF